MDLTLLTCGHCKERSSLQKIIHSNGTEQTELVVMFWTCIQAVLNPSLGRNITFPGWFLQFPQVNTGRVFSNRPPLHIIHYQFPIYFDFMTTPEETANLNNRILDYHSLLQCNAL
jgi:hypothetical protein